MSDGNIASVSRFLERFEPADTTWLLTQGVERNIGPGTTVVTEGSPLESLLFVIDGLFDVILAGFPGQPVAHIGPGEVVGELSFLDGQPPVASVVAREPSRLLDVPRRVLHQRFQADPVFAARFYSALGATAAERLRALRAEAPRSPVVDRGLDANRSWLELESLIEQLKEQFVNLVEPKKRGKEPLAAIPSDELMEQFQFLVLRMNELLGKQSTEPPGFCKLIGRRVQRELLPYMLLSESSERFYMKPRGYAGDYFTIELVYRNKPNGSGSLGRLVDACFLVLPAAIAVRNRRGLLAREIAEAIVRSGSGPARVTSIACGPAAEIFDVYAGMSDPSRLAATLLDVDAEAIAFVRERISRAGVDAFVRLIHENVLYLALGRRRIELEPQDLIYSIGLIDYFDDKTVLRLMNYVHSLLKPGGRVILGNFHPGNPCRALMDHVLEWELIHRDEDDMNRLYAASAFGKPCSRILFEEQGINLFAECVK